MKTWYLGEAVTDDAGRLTVKDVAEFRAKYPMLLTSKRVKSQSAANMMARLKLVHTVLRRPPPKGGYAVTVCEQESVRVSRGEVESVLEEIGEPKRLLEKSSGRPSPRGSSAA